MTETPNPARMTAYGSEKNPMAISYYS